MMWRFRPKAHHTWRCISIVLTSWKARKTLRKKLKGKLKEKDNKERNALQLRYREGGIFKSAAYEDSDTISSFYAWKHLKTGIIVWKDAMDLSSLPNPKVYFHYTGDPDALQKLTKFV